MHDFTPWSALVGGSLIGLAASLLLLANGRIAGISGILGGLLILAKNPVSNPTPEGDWFLGVLQETGYLLRAVAITEILVGALLLSGYFLPLALVLFAPIMLSIFFFHIFLQFAGIETALVAAAFYAHLVYIHRHRYSDILSP